MPSLKLVQRKPANLDNEEYLFLGVSEAGNG